jgi:hypothetical protein
VLGAFVLVPAYAAAIGCVERFDPQCNLVVFHRVTLAAFGSKRIRFSSPHGNSGSVATSVSRDSKHRMLDPDKTVIGDPVPLILRQWLQAWRPCFTAPSWEHVLVLVMGALLAIGKRTVTSCLRVTGRAEASNFASYHQILNRARWSSRVSPNNCWALWSIALCPTGLWSSVWTTPLSADGDAASAHGEYIGIQCGPVTAISSKPAGCAG